MTIQSYEIPITVIIIRDGKYLITRRSAHKKKWPLKWTVPGGRLEVEDYIGKDKDTINAWYNILEKAAKREVLEEVGLEKILIILPASLRNMEIPRRAP